MPLQHLFAHSGGERSGLLHGVPVFDAHPYLLFAVYYLVFDCVYYCMHRAEHAIPWWWALHSLHHMRAYLGHERLHRCNFSQAFPVWDILFGTALYGRQPQSTGVTDPVVDADNERGLLGQQWAALRRFRGAIGQRAGWRPGDVSFGSDFQPVADAQRANRDARMPTLGGEHHAR